MKSLLVKCGVLLVELEQTGQRRTPKTARSKDKVSLDQLGVTAKQSERFQQAAAAPAAKVEAAFKTARETKVPVSGCIEPVHYSAADR